MEDKKILLCCPKCTKLLAKMDKEGSCKKIYLYCKNCKKEYEITYRPTKE